MRFKAKLQNEQVHLLYSLIGPISRLTSVAVLYLDPNHVRLSTRDSCGDGIACFTELTTTNGIFLSHRVESAANNAIVFEIDLTQWRTALHSVLGGSSEQQRRNGRGDDDSLPMGPVSSITTFKLAKRNGGMPCLCIDASCSPLGVDVHHAIPVRIMPAKDMQFHLPPKINVPDVQLELSATQPLRIVVERLKSISPHVYMEGSMAGELTLRIVNDGASIRTYFSKLVPRFDDCKSSQPDTSCKLKVDTKKLSTCLQWQATMAKHVSSALLCMVENEMLVLHIVLNPADVGFFTYYIPVHFLSNDVADE
jgi:HUS1 checkpoint protein